MKKCMLLLAALLLLTGCQIHHTLKEPNIVLGEPLPPINVVMSGDVPAPLIRNYLRGTGAFEQVTEGYDRDGYNLVVISQSNYWRWHNIPRMFLSAFTFFLVPAPTYWDSRIGFLVSKGEKPLRSYEIANHTEHRIGLIPTGDARGANVRVIVDTFVAQVLADPPFDKLAYEQSENASSSASSGSDCGKPECLIE
ncbi:hypothetical protein [Pseudomonas tohonis]|uniref:hypothetical protein n=1 Tax=Pseudomonas tohonis TaxID=2725477 RepID=UPI0021DB1BFA|nr:hypothetical protein [Pseudomonas tohonis]UXY50979.1 hypothetical protein N9L84_18635 [Pseudomonas tohonis]